MSRRRRTVATRDQHVSVFSAVLMRLCDGVGAIGVALVDGEGETVDYAGNVHPFDIKIAAAEISVLLDVLRRTRVPQFREMEELVVRGTKGSYYAHALGEGYAVVLLLPPYAFAVSRRALAEAIREVCRESGLSPSRIIAAEREQWVRVEVRCDKSSPMRPAALWLSGSWRPLDVLGTYRVDPTRRDVGYRARLHSGAELTLVREPLGRWYADTLPEA